MTSRNALLSQLSQLPQLSQPPTAQSTQGPGGAQPCMQEGFIHHKGLPQTMQLLANYYNIALAGKPKGMKQILMERGLRNRE